MLSERVERERKVPTGIGSQFWLGAGKPLGSLEGENCGAWLTKEQATHTQMQMRDSALRMAAHHVLQASFCVSEIILRVRLQGESEIGPFRPARPPPDEI